MSDLVWNTQVKMKKSWKEKYGEKYLKTMPPDRLACSLLCFNHYP